MPDLNKISNLNEADRQVASVLSKLKDMLHEVRGSRGDEVLKEIYDKIGSSVVEFMQQLEKMTSEQPGDNWKKREVYSLDSIREFAELNIEMDKYNPDAGANGAKNILDQYINKFSGKSAKVIRDGLYHILNNEALYGALDVIIRRIGNDEKLPPQLEETVKKLVPILEASDSVGDDESSRFLSKDVFLTRDQDTQGNSKKYAEKVRNAIKALG